MNATGTRKPIWGCSETLAALALNNARPAPKPYKLADSGGLYALVKPSGSKLWRFSCRFGGKRLPLSLGSFPEVGVADGREARDEARKSLRAGLNPADAMRRGKQDRQAGPTDVALREVSRRWFDARRSGWVEAYTDRLWNRIDGDVLSVWGDKAIAEIDSAALLSALGAVQSRSGRIVRPK